MPTNLVIIGAGGSSREIPRQDALDPYLFHLSQSLVCGLSDLA